MLNPNNEKYFVKTIEYKLQYIIYDSNTTAKANLISLDNIAPRVKSHFQLPSLLILWSCHKKIIHAMYYNWQRFTFHCTYRRISFVKALPTQFYQFLYITTINYSQFFCTCSSNKTVLIKHDTCILKLFLTTAE